METSISKILEEKGGEIVFISPNSIITEAVAIMNDHKIGSTVVQEKDQLVGILTQNDIMQRVLGKSLNPDCTLVNDIMTKKLFKLNSGTTIREALAVMTKNEVHHLVITDAHVPVGIVSCSDITRHLISDQETDIEELISYISGGVY